MASPPRRPRCLPAHRGMGAAHQINSIGGAYAYQYEVLRAAFDGAWIPA